MVIAIFLIVFIISVFILLGVGLYMVAKLEKQNTNKFVWRYDEEDPIDGYIDYYWFDDDAEVSDSADE